MAHYDVFNGDADGICALQQLRLATPLTGQLVTGVKRDIQLLKQVTATQNDTVTVLDISLDKNRDDVLRIINAGAQLEYFDHHYAGDIPEHAGLTTHIDTSSDICTSLLVNKSLQGKFVAWAIAGTYGDNLYDSAAMLADELSLSGEQRELLKELGTYLNYNGYGASLDDLYFKPDELYKKVSPYADPFEFIAKDEAFQILKDGYASDMENIRTAKAALETPTHAMLVLPDAAWARRVSGVYANELARGAPDRAHAILNEMADGTYRISVRAPLNNKTGADELCRAFPTGGGRQAAAGINELPKDQYEQFVKKFSEAFVPV